MHPERAELILGLIRETVRKSCMAIEEEIRKVDRIYDFDAEDFINYHSNVLGYIVGTMVLALSSNLKMPKNKKIELRDIIMKQVVNISLQALKKGDPYYDFWMDQRQRPTP